MATTTIELPPDVKRELEALARRTGRTEAELIVEAVERHLQAEQRPRPKAIGVYSDPEVTGENYEDWLATNWKPDWE
jgi:hypothetical protein